jgi:acetyl-CoA carboxylase carboxyl transferase subunit alpha
MRSYLDFEKPVAELEAKIEELRALQANGDGVAIGEEINRIEVKAAQALKDLYDELTPWQKTQVARHPQRPHCLDYVATLIDDFVALAGDRKHGEDAAFAATASVSSAMRKAPTRRPGSSTISAWRGRKATARRRG